MDSKINWYKEVLALEPSSKLFFPLAKLQAESGEYVEALSTLQQGLEKHPEHLEAQLFLVEVLANLGRNDEAQETASSLIEKLSTYAAFWEEWAKLSAYKEEDRDTALALNFLAASFNGNPIGWSEIIERGLLTLLSDENSRSSRSMRTHMNDAMERMAAKVSSNELLDRRELGVETGESRTAAPSSEEQDAEEETFSLRTRSMAELLAQQGDYQGAVEIYRELLNSLDDENVRSELEARLKELVALQSQEHEGEKGRETGQAQPLTESAEKEQAGSEKAASAEQPPKQGKKRLIHTLEALAQRLEARAAG